MRQLLLAHLSQRLKGELIVYQLSCRLCVCLAVCVSVNIFKVEYLRNQWANRNEILNHHWGGGKAALGFGLDGIGTLMSMAMDSSHRVIMGEMLSAL